MVIAVPEMKAMNDPGVVVGLQAEE